MFHWPSNSFNTVSEELTAKTMMVDQSAKKKNNTRIY